MSKINVPCIQICAVSHNGSFKTFKSELYTMVGQAILWKRIHGWPVHMYCDNYTHQLIKELNLSHLWDKIDTEVLQRDFQIDGSVFWASSKIKVISQLEAPFFMCDLDFISWFDLTKTKAMNSDIVVFHKEDRKSVMAYSNVEPDSIMNEANFNQMDGFNWNIDPFNTAAVLMMSNELKDKFCSLSLDFMRASSKVKDSSYGDSERMVFAEQRILASIVKTFKFKYSTFLKAVYNENATWKNTWKDRWLNRFPWKKCVHIWLDKFNFKEHPDAEIKYINLVKDLTGNAEELKKIDTINPKWIANIKIDS